MVGVKIRKEGVGRGRGTWDEGRGTRTWDVRRGTWDVGRGTRDEDEDETRCEMRGARNNY